MKKTLSSFLFLLTVLLLHACSMRDSPGDAAGKFLNAFNERDFEKARKYATPETIKLVDLMENLTKLSQGTDSLPKASININGERIEGDIAYVTFTESGSDQPQEIQLKKIDGQWLVHITKEDIAAKDMLGSAGEEEEGLWSDQDSLEGFDEELVAE